MLKRDTVHMMASCWDKCSELYKYNYCSNKYTSPVIVIKGGYLLYAKSYQADRGISKVPHTLFAAHYS